MANLRNVANVEREREIVLALVRQGSLSKQRAQTAYQAARQAGTSILNTVVSLGFVTREEVDEMTGRMPEEAASLQEVDMDVGVGRSSAASWPRGCGGRPCPLPVAPRLDSLSRPMA